MQILNGWIFIKIFILIEKSLKSKEIWYKKKFCHWFWDHTCCSVVKTMTHVSLSRVVGSNPRLSTWWYIHMNTHVWLNYWFQSHFFCGRVGEAHDSWSDPSSSYSVVDEWTPVQVRSETLPLDEITKWSSTFLFLLRLWPDKMSKNHQDTLK